MLVYLLACLLVYKVELDCYWISWKMWLLDFFSYFEAIFIEVCLSL